MKGGVGPTRLYIMKDEIKRLADFRKNMLIFAGSSVLGMAYAYKISGNKLDSSAFKLTLGMAIVFTIVALFSHFRIISLQKNQGKIKSENKKASNSKPNNSNKKSKNTKKRNVRKKK